jgi:preprotein translocase subunit SecE
LRDLKSGTEKSIEIKELINEIKKIIWTNYKNF